MNLIFYVMLLFGSLFAWSNVVNIKGVMESKQEEAFVLTEISIDLSEDCTSLSIKRGILDDVLDSYIESNWSAGEVLRVAVPKNAFKLTGCEVDEDDIEDVDEVSQGFSGISSSAGPNEGASDVEIYDCDSSEYRALEERVNSYNARAEDGSRMDLPPCRGGADSTTPYCDSEEYREETAQARRNGDPVGPCKRRGDDVPQREGSGGGVR